MTPDVRRNDGHLCYPYGDASADEAILAAVLNALHRHPGVPQDQVKVEVSHGCAVLSGKVAHNSQSEWAEQCASTTPGVMGITNLITVEHGIRAAGSHI